jgi:hypothetical protein
MRRALRLGGLTAVAALAAVAIALDREVLDEPTGAPRAAIPPAAPDVEPRAPAAAREASQERAGSPPASGYAMVAAATRPEDRALLVDIARRFGRVPPAVHEMIARARSGAPIDELRAMALAIEPLAVRAIVLDHVVGGAADSAAAAVHALGAGDGAGRPRRVRGLEPAQPAVDRRP